MIPLMLKPLCRGVLTIWLGMMFAATFVLSPPILSPALADVIDGLTDQDRLAIRRTIEGQIEAFEADDADLAFSFASPSIRERFGDASRFIAMVRRGYRPVYRPREVEFTELLDVRGRPTQSLTVIGPDNEVFNAYYVMQRQDDGSWRISGCILRPIGDELI